MTISLIHFNPQLGLSASITATGGPSVGGYVNHSWRSLGACVTQGLFTNPWYPEFVKQQLENGSSAKSLIAQIRELDSESAKRQCMVIDNQGKIASLDGEENIPYVGHMGTLHTGVAGNMLESRAVIEQFYTHFIKQACVNSGDVLASDAHPSYQESYQQQLPHILIDSLSSALEAGGDKRGTFSASMRIESLDQAPIDIRVDWTDGDIIQDMRKVLSRVQAPSFQEFLSQLPSSIQI
ncbi:DUF1028 domain-containing protein [Vibrio superstes]|uniref:Pilus assembly protein n=1 Tax=Vibrio superstes NBRC 103154 TaxID=1219062 RepID=A0A511QW86_9VIBR|nr:DUF1028 domain-containing protein [Vibrio superstes]GEM81625.1 pilus assembly protein [Vibrio superstes NBRC 103154]